MHANHEEQWHATLQDLLSSGRLDSGAHQRLSDCWQNPQQETSSTYDLLLSLLPAQPGPAADAIYTLFTLLLERELPGFTPEDLRSAQVDFLSRYANRCQDRERLTEIFHFVQRILSRIALPALDRKLRDEPHTPWRVLLLNAGILATRSHDPELIIPAYQRIQELLPLEATHFFAQAMEQMERIGYPSRVRQVVEQFHKGLAPGQPKH